ncbi:MAG: hypothetical protein OXG35_15495 [Acidobacteria bacterium]|nr:hypothetical protein [Acidobacteriota bacterium]
MTGQRLIVAAGFVALAGFGDGSELRRALNDIIDQRGAGAAEQAAVYAAFEAELAEELMAEWGATADDGCPELETVPPGPGIRFLMSVIAGTASTAERDRGLEAQRARRTAWVRNVPGQQCRCLQGTILNVRRAAAGLAGPGRFEKERAELAALTEDELLLAAPTLRGSAEQYSAERARERVERWEARRYGESGEPGWQAAAERGESEFGPMSPFMSCDSV